MRRNGLTTAVIISAVLGSTLVLVLILAFLYLGYTSLVTEINFANAIISSIAVLGTSGGVSVANSPKVVVPLLTIHSITLFLHR